jgi:hypothetical protein
MFLGLSPSLVLIATCITCSTADSTNGAPHARREFANAITNLKEGTTEAEVLALLGRPDDVRTKNDPGGISTFGTREVWRYGTSGHLTTATLGQVCIDESGRVQYISGKGSPSLGELPEEDELRRLLDILGQVPSYNAGSHYNPGKVIRAVNCLLPLGKKRAIAVMDEFLRVTPPWYNEGRDGVFLVLRTLFDVPRGHGHMPRMGVGATSEPEDDRLLPRFPIALQDDIPFLLVEGYVLGGAPEQPESHVAYFRKHGSLRTKPLVPTDRPLEALDRLSRSVRRAFRETNDPDNDERRCLLGNQVLRLMDSVYRVEPDVFGDLLPSFDEEDAERRRQIITQASSLKIRWDARQIKYIFLDGTSLPDTGAPHYRREIWSPALPGTDTQLILARTGPHYVSVSLEENYQVGKQKTPAVFKVFDVKSRANTIVELRTGSESPCGSGQTRFDVGTETGGTRITTKTISLKEGTELQVEMILAGEQHLSPVFKP